LQSVLLDEVGDRIDDIILDAEKTVLAHCSAGFGAWWVAAVKQKWTPEI
jgi:hypothetical protein